MGILPSERLYRPYRPDIDLGFQGGETKSAGVSIYHVTNQPVFDSFTSPHVGNPRHHDFSDTDLSTWRDLRYGCFSFPARGGILKNKSCYEVILWLMN